MKRKLTTADFVIAIALILWGLAIFYPFYNTVLVSFMTEAEYLQRPFALYVKDVTFDAYKEVFSNNKVPNGFAVSLRIVFTVVPLHLIIVTASAYALSRKRFMFRNAINNMCVFSMYFSGGVIPLYLLIQSMGLIDSLWSIMLPPLWGTYNMILVKNYFHSLTDSLEESAKIDGANDLLICFRIYAPLAKPILATITLFAVVGQWNSWYNALLFLNSTAKWPLQLVLREVIGQAAERLTTGDIAAEDIGLQSFSSSIKMATVVVTMVPIMMVYPFVQRYYIKGLMVGAVKS